MVYIFTKGLLRSFLTYCKLLLLQLLMDAIWELHWIGMDSDQVDFTSPTVDELLWRVKLGL